MGTSLTVHPFATLAEIPLDRCPRVLINMEAVGDIGDNPDDLLLLGQCDQIVEELCKELGWDEDLRRLWVETEASVIADPLTAEEEEEKNEEWDPLAALEAIEARLFRLTVAEEKVLGRKEDSTTDQKAADAEIGSKEAKQESTVSSQGTPVLEVPTSSSASKRTAEGAKDDVSANKEQKP